MKPKPVDKGPKPGNHENTKDHSTHEGNEISAGDRHHA